VNAKSIMGVMMLAASQGSIVIITTEGIDEIEALNSLSALINDFFGEGE
jgi:phosphocarrier protein